MIRQYTNCEDIRELLNLLCCMHSIALPYSKFGFSWQNVPKFTVRGNRFTVSLYHIKFSDFNFFPWFEDWLQPVRAKNLQKPVEISWLLWWMGKTQIVGTMKSLITKSNSFS